MIENKKIFLHKPQINLSYSSTGRMWLVAFCAFLGVLQSAINDGWISVIPMAAAVSTAVILELLLTFKEKGAEKIKDGSAVCTAMILTLMLPNTMHPVYVIFGAAFAVVAVKHCFGGLGSNWLNPALGGWLFIKVCWPRSFTEALNGVSAPIYELGGTGEISNMDNSITEFLNSSVFSITGVQLPSGYIDLFSCKDPGIIADRGLFFLLAGTIIVTAALINRGWIPAVFLLVYGFLVKFAGDASGLLWNGDVLYGVFSGGAILTAFILVAEPASSAKLRSGVVLTVVLTAVLSWFFRYKGGEYLGCFIALALVNCLTPIIRHLEDRFLILHKNRSKFQENIL